MQDFLAENNACGQTILQLVSRGNAITAELLRLKDYIPKIYKLDSKQNVQKYSEIIQDFNYFKHGEEQEQKIEANESLAELDNEFKENHLEIITRFYLAFESIHTFISDLNHFLEELEEGYYIHQTLETVFVDFEGKQLLCEALYLYGVMLLLVDSHIEGVVRERILVSYYRYTPQRRDTQSCIDEVCKLLRDTGLHTKKPNNYPEDYFRRVPIKQNYVEMAIGRLRSDDIYSQISIYPLPKHRSTALSNQAAMLYVCLYFCPSILHSQPSIMREIVDKFFPDNYTISIYMGHIASLPENWEAFKAAKQALNNTLEPSNLKNHCQTYGSIETLLKTTNQLLKEGTITKETLLKDINKIINILRECNVSIRWLMLHTSQSSKNKKLKQLKDLITSESKIDQITLFKLLLNTAQLELITKEMFKTLLSEKEQQFDQLKKESIEVLEELSQVFGGTKPLTKIQKNENLHLWFLEISKQVGTVENESRKLVQLIQALDEVQEFHQLGNNMQIVQCLSDTKKNLNMMIRTLNIREDVLVTLQVVGDLSYAWELIDSYTEIMQAGVKREPTLVIKLRAVFLKLSSALEIPLMRINQAKSEDLVSVSQYYSSELEIYIRKVLQIIPQSMFAKMERVIEMQTGVLKELPTRVDKDKLRDYAQLDERFEFAELTHSISVFSQGMRMMKSTLVGVICLDPKRLLEDGIRKELVLNVSKALHKELSFGAKPKQDELEGKLRGLGVIMDGYKRSFEYIQDYINVNGLKIWQEEVTRIVNFNVEQECNGFLRNKVHGWQSVYQSRYVPIPIYPGGDGVSQNFIGRLAREIIRLTDPRSSIYLTHTSTWYDIKTHKPIFNKETVSLISKAIEIAGLAGLDRLFSFMIVSSMQKIADCLENKGSKSKAWNNVISAVHKEYSGNPDPPNPPKFYQTLIARTTKIWSEFLDLTMLIGQLQLLRVLFAFHLNKSCKFNAKNLESSLRTFNKALLHDINKDEYNPSEELLLKLSTYFDYAGLNNPLEKVYITSKNDKDHSITLFIFAIAHLSKAFLPRNLKCFSKRSQDQLDGTALAVGIHSILKQFHHEINHDFVKRFSNYILSFSAYSGSLKSTEVPQEVIIGINFLETYTDFSGASLASFKEVFPEEILHVHQTLMS